MTPDITIIMPTFGQSKYIDKTLESIANQEFENWELIIVLDGEDAPTEKIIKEWLDKDMRMKLIKKPNGGTGSSLNRGFLSSKGRYETWFASDNIMYPNCLQSLISELNNNLNIGFVYSDMYIGEMDETGLIETEKLLLSNTMGIDMNWEIEKTIRAFYFGICWLWRKDVRLVCGPFQPEPSEDYDMVLRMQEVTKFKYIPEILGWYRRHKENMTNKIAKTGPDPNYYMNFVTGKAKKRRPDLYGVK